MTRFIPIEEEEILTSPEDAGKMLSHALHRKHTMRFSALCPAGNGVLIAVLESSKEPAPETEFIFSPLEDSTFDGVTAALQARITAGYTVLATFTIAGDLWGLFSREKIRAPEKS